MARCPYGADCFAEKARAEAGNADIVVTNHALLAIDALAEASVLPEHNYVVVDEAHELVDRVTSVATGELTPAPLGVATRRITRLVRPELTQRLEAAVATFSSAIHDAEPGRIDYLDDELATYLTALRTPPTAPAPTSTLRPGTPRRPRRAPRRSPRWPRSATPPHGCWTRSARDTGADRCGGWIRKNRSAGSTRPVLRWRRCRWPVCCAAGCSTEPPRC
jgi:ATP-dependent DNA helicase DinG